MNEKMSDKNDDKFADPKTAFLFEIENAVKEIRNDLFNFKQVAASRKMSVLIQQLDIPDDDERFKEIREIKKNWLPTYCNCSPFRISCYGFKEALIDSEIDNVWTILQTFLNQTYFKGWNTGGKPQQSTPGHKL